MATYVTTIRFTEQGLQGIRDTGKRASSFKAAAEKMGVKVSAIYWTLGAFDGLLIYDAPDDAAATAAMLQLASQGNVQTTTSRAFNSSEMEKIVGALQR